MVDHYAVLNVAPTATADEVRAAHARERARWAARAVVGDADADERLRQLDEAFAVLGDAGRRAAFDRLRPSQPTVGPLAIVASGAALPAVELSPGILQKACPHCGAANPVRAMTCAICGEQIARACPQCGQALALTEAVCPRCETIVAEYDRKRYRDASALEERIDRERDAEDAAKVVANAEYHARVWSTTIFWAVVIGLGILLLLLAAVGPGLFHA